MKKLSIFFAICLFTQILSADSITLQQGTSFSGCTDATIISKNYNSVNGATTNTGSDQTLGITYSRYQSN